MRCSVLLTAPDGTSNARWLGQLGGVSGLQYTHTFPGGPASFQVNLDTQPDRTDLSLTPGARVSIFAGTGLVWAGRLDTAVRGTPWRLNGTGIGAETRSWVAIPSSGSNANLLNDIIDQAISRGLRITRPTSLTNPTGTRDAATVTLDQVLGDAAGSGLWWQVSPAGVISQVALPTSPTYLLHPTAPPGGRSLADFATVLVGRYVDSGTGANATVTATASSATLTRYGRIEKPVDLTGRGSMTSTAATTILTNLLAQQLPRASWTDTVTVGYGQLRTLGDAPVDLATVTPGVAVQSVLVDPDTWAGDPANSGLFVMGQTTYGDDHEVLDVAPMQTSPNDLTSTLALGAAA